MHFSSRQCAPHGTNQLRRGEPRRVLLRGILSDFSQTSQPRPRLPTTKAGPANFFIRFRSWCACKIHFLGWKWLWNLAIFIGHPVKWLKVSNVHRVAKRGPRAAMHFWVRHPVRNTCTHMMTWRHCQKVHQAGFAQQQLLLHCKNCLEQNSARCERACAPQRSCGAPFLQNFKIHKLLAPPYSHCTVNNQGLLMTNKNEENATQRTTAKSSAR